MNHRYNPSSPRDEFGRREGQQGHQGYGRQQGDDLEAQRWERDYEPGEHEPYRGRASASERGYSEYGQDYDSPWGEQGAMRGGSYGQRYGGEGGGSRGQSGGYGGQQGYGQGRSSRTQSSHGWYGGQREEQGQGRGGWQNQGWQDQGGDDMRYLGGRESGGRGGEQRYGGEYQAGRYGGMGGGMGQGQGMGQGMGRSLRGKGPKGYQRSDERIREDVCERLSDDPEIDASDIEVQVKQGNVTLQGEVPSRYMKHRAEDCADACSGVKDVDNRIHISASAGEAQHGEGQHGGIGSATAGGGTSKPS